jgi:hypothetical protein
MQYDKQTVAEVWSRARAVNELGPDEWRLDLCGAWIRRDQYNATSTDFAWKIVQTKPGEDGEHLQALHHDNEYDPVNHQPHCHVSADHRDQPAGTCTLPPANRRTGK